MSENTTIITESSKAGRSIELPMPKILAVETLDDLVAIQGVDLCLSQALAQLKISFRSHIRTKLESATDEVPTYSNEEIVAMDFSDWKPESRTRLTAEEKAVKAFGILTPEERKKLMALLVEG